MARLGLLISSALCLWLRASSSRVGSFGLEAPVADSQAQPERASASVHGTSFLQVWRGLSAASTSPPAGSCQKGAPSNRSQANPSVFVLVPGLGNPSHLALVQQSVAWLRRQSANVTCAVYVYNAALQVPAGMLAPCELRYTQGQWTHFVQEAPEQEWSSKDFVLVWLDDVLIDERADLRLMTQVMRENQLGVGSPSYAVANSDGRWPVMQQAQDSPVGRYTNFVEFQFTLMTPASFRCLRGMIEPQVNPHGWGLDKAFATMCPGHCLGVFDMVTMTDTSTCSYDCEAARAEMQAFVEEHGTPPEPRTLGTLRPLPKEHANSTLR